MVVAMSRIPSVTCDHAVNDHPAMLMTAMRALDDMVAVDGVVEQRHELLVTLMAVHHGLGFFVVS